ncbi:MAG: hypothetical protein WA418_08855 [Bradyrhizobium sp.]
MAHQPTLYELSGSGIHVTYATSSIEGKPHFSYHDAFQAKTFSGNEIQSEDTLLGTLVSVYLMRVVDGPSTSFTLLLPSVRLPQSGLVTISTEGITTLHKSSIVGLPQGQTEVYGIHPLQGTARFVVF